MVLGQSSTLVLSTPKQFRNADKYTDVYTHRYVYNCACVAFQTWKGTPAKPKPVVSVLLFPIFIYNL